jgi:Predicted metal-dependent RNase, consists of a metallo-beta-lactamase domain and an RNA-binding KH domain
MVEVSSSKEKLLYTGDFNLATSKLLEPASNQGLKIDNLVTESTYSGKDDVFKPEKVYHGPHGKQPERHYNKRGQGDSYQALQ